MRTIMITGASTGFGEAIARTMSRENGRLILTARREDKLMKVVDEDRKSVV